MFVTKYKNIFLTIGAVVMALSVGAILYFGLTLGIDFTGGSILEVSFADRPEIAAVEDVVASAGIEDASVRPAGDDQYIIRTSVLSAENRQAILSGLEDIAGTQSTASASETATTTATSSSDLPAATSASSGVAQAVSSTTQAAVTQERFSAIGPTVGSELRTNAIYGIIGVVLAIILFVTFAFRKVSEPVSSWKYGSVAIVALIHDILVPAGLFAILGATLGAQVDLLFVMALLAILGFSVNDTIVVFDRIRENLQEHYDRGKESFSDIVGKSLSQTYARSLNTSLTTLVVLAALYLLGGESTELFSLTLLVGVIAGTYSSIFLASPLLVKVYEWQKK